MPWIDLGNRNILISRTALMTFRTASHLVCSYSSIFPNAGLVASQSLRDTGQHFKLLGSNFLNLDSVTWSRGPQIWVFKNSKGVCTVRFENHWLNSFFPYFTLISPSNYYHNDPSKIRILILSNEICTYYSPAYHPIKSTQEKVSFFNGTRPYLVPCPILIISQILQPCCS